MISLYSTWWVKPDKIIELITPLKQLAAAVEKNEKGTLMYLVNYPRFDFPTVKPGKNPIISQPMVRPGTIVFLKNMRIGKPSKLTYMGHILQVL